ncbi:hypothetical protein G6F22_017057 [Rhizopus arrhizus]|nr:hypothetical protein G6F22_017057 [Rhizopus arrhizus]
MTCRSTASPPVIRRWPTRCCRPNSRPALLPAPAGRQPGPGADVPVPPPGPAYRLEPVLRARRQAGGQVHRPGLPAVARAQPVRGQLDAQSRLRAAARSEPLRGGLDRLADQGRAGRKLHLHPSRDPRTLPTAARRPAQAGAASAGRT